MNTLYVFHFDFVQLTIGGPKHLPVIKTFCPAIKTFCLFIYLPYHIFLFTYLPAFLRLFTC